MIADGNIQCDEVPAVWFRNYFLSISICLSAHTSAADLQHQIFLKSSRAQTFYVEGRFPDGEPLMFLLDTGSSYTVINAKDLARLQDQGRAEYLKNLDGRLADGSRLGVPLYRISSITLDGNCVVSDVEVAVFPNADRQILGLNTLLKLSPFLFEVDPPSLKLSNCGRLEAKTASKEEDLGKVQREIAMTGPENPALSAIPEAAVEGSGGDSPSPSGVEAGPGPSFSD